EMARSFRGSALWLSPWWDQFQATAEVLRGWRCSGQAVSREAASCPAPPPQTQARSRESWRLCRGTDLSGSRLPAFLPPLTFLNLLASSASFASSASLEPVPLRIEHFQLAK